MKTRFDYQGALEAGYSDDEIMSHLSEIHPDFDVQGAISSGYTQSEINQHLSTYKKEKSPLEKGARIAGQFALGAAETVALPYDLLATSMSLPGAQRAAIKESVGSELDRLIEQKMIGDWDENDQKRYDELVSRNLAPESTQESSLPDMTVRGLLEKGTGVDLTPEGTIEKAAHWMGIIKNPKNWASLAKKGISKKEIAKAILPSKTDITRGALTGAALQTAEDGELGPIGTFASAIVADIAAAGLAGAVKGAKHLVKEPKKTLAKAAAALTPADKRDLQREIIKDFREAGLEADLGTITDSNLIKWTQSRLAQSGLTGKALEDLRDRVTGQVKNEYGAIAKELGEARFTNNHEAGLVVKDTLSRVRDEDLRRIRSLYSTAENSLKETSAVDSKRLISETQAMKKKLSPGSIKSSEQQAVLSAIEKLEQDLTSASKGSSPKAFVKELMNNKIALNDIINYEVQGGTKQLLKHVVEELDRAIISHGKDNPVFAKNYVTANKKFSAHAKTFRNKSIDQVFRSNDPAKILDKMNTTQGIKDIEKALSTYAEGKQLFNDLKRYKLDQIIGNNLVDGTTQQIKLGTFSNLLEKGRNREVIKEILDAKNFKKLEKLQKNAGRLADSANQFYNASKSGVVAVDAAGVLSLAKAVVGILTGNPWPLMKVSGGIMASRMLSKLLSDPEFLKLAEEAVLAQKSGNTKKMFSVMEQLIPYSVEFVQSFRKEE